MRASGVGGPSPEGQVASDSNVPRVGDVLDGRYRITGVLGSGGMGCVFLGEHVAIRRPLAIKLLHPEVEGIDGISERFQREAFAIGRVDHPNCVNVSDFGQLSDGTLYMVLELLDGVPLFDLLKKERRLDWRRTLRIARHVLSALAYAHEVGIVHRDVKPENIILVSDSGDPDFAKILDFGIAKLLDDAHTEAGVTGLTQVGVTIGTPTYIAPEQAFGQPIDARADLYALSVTLFEMIAGAPPFEAETVIALLTMHATAEVPRFCDVAPGLRVPPEVEEMIRRGLEKKADERIQTAAEYIARIDHALGGASASEAILVRDGSARPSSSNGIDSVRAKAHRRLESWAAAVRGITTQVQSIASRRSPKELLGIGAGVAAALVLVFAVFGTGRLESYIHDLKEGDTCEVRREAVADLRSLGDKRAIPALREAKRARPAGFLKRRPNSNDCLRADAAEAIRHLESL